MDADATGDQAPVVTLLVGGVAQAWEPFEGGGNFTAVRQPHHQGIILKADVGGEYGRWAARSCRFSGGKGSHFTESIEIFGVK